MSTMIANSPKITRRMKWIIKQMKEHDAVIQEHRDAFLEKSWWELQWEGPDLCPDCGQHPKYHSAEVTEKMRQKLIRAGLIKMIEHNPVHRHGKFITSESVYGLSGEANDR
jgi:hypothetical protein